MAVATRKSKSKKIDLTAKLEEQSGTEQLSAAHIVYSIVDIPLADIGLHADNRDLKNDDSIDELSQSIEQLGQLEPATVRKLPNNKYELLSGERRYRALKKLGRMFIRATVVSEEAPQALVRLAAANSHRKDLDPIERAELIAKLMRPIADGGSGLDRTAAGLAVGFRSDSATKNALRMLRLPDAIKSLVTGGKLSERAARRLIPYVDMPKIMEEISKELTTNNESIIELSTNDEDLPWWLESIIDDNTRPMDDTTKRNAGELVKGCWNMYPKLFESSDEYDRQLAPFEIKDGDKKRLVTLNCELWDRLQKPCVEKIYNKGGKSTASNTKATSSEGGPTPAELKAKKAKQEQLLNDFSSRFVAIALRCQLAHDTPTDRRLVTLGSVVQEYRVSCYEWIEAAYHEADCDPNTNTDDEYLRYWWGSMLWPVSRKSKVPRKLFTFAPSGELPDLDKLPRLGGTFIASLAKRCDVTFKDFWKSSTVESSEQRQLLALWLGRHTVEQLQKLMKELGLSTSLAKRSDLVQFVLDAHKSGKQLPIPKRLGVRLLFIQ